MRRIWFPSTLPTAGVIACVLSVASPAAAGGDEARRPAGATPAAAAPAATASGAQPVPESVPPLKTDRPGFNAPAAVQDPGVLQLETGWSMSRGRDGSTSSSGPQPLFRLGLAPRVELQLASAGLLAGCVVDCQWHRADMSVGARVLLPTERLGIAMAVTGALSLPFGDDVASSGHRDPVAVVSVERALGAHLGVSYNAIVVQAHEGDDGVARYGHGVGLGYSLERWAPFVAVGRRAARSADGVPWVAQVGTSFRLASDAQVDVSLDRGLTPAEPRWGVSAGLSLRYRHR